MKKKNEKKIEKKGKKNLKKKLKKKFAKNVLKIKKMEKIIFEQRNFRKKKLNL